MLALGNGTFVLLLSTRPRMVEEARAENRSAWSITSRKNRTEICGDDFKLQSAIIIPGFMVRATQR